ncbi:MAG: ATP-binding protein [Gammaproteobacteria bacterium]
MFSSIRQRLIFTLLLIIILVGSVSIVRSYLDARYEIQELFDAQLAQSARFIQAKALDRLQHINPASVQAFLDSQAHIPLLHMNGNGNHEREEVTAYGHEYERKIAFQIWNNNKQKILHSAASPVVALSEKALTPENSGFADVKHDDGTWRVFSLWDNNNQYVIQIGERYDIRNELAGKISQRLIMPSLVSLPILTFMIWFGVGRGLSPLLQFTQEISQRSPGNLKPVTSDSLPAEINPLATALNDLLVQLADALQKERNFTDDAAHELRTPLAALKTQAQVAMRSSNNQERQHAIKQIIEGVDRATHIVQQLLSLARLNQEKTEITKTSINLNNFVAEIIAQYANLAINKNIDIGLDGDNDIQINTETTVLSMLLGNLLDNAIKYTPDNGNINITIKRVKKYITLSIVDTGPGINQDLKQRVFDRFYRIPNRNNISGCGLGLSIVQQCANILSAKLEIADNFPTGLAITIKLPA